MANNLEGGKSPQLRPEVLQELGFKLVAYPLSLLAVCVRAMQGALGDLAQGRLPPASAMPSFQVPAGLRTYAGLTVESSIVTHQLIPLWLLSVSGGKVELVLSFVM